MTGVNAGDIVAEVAHAMEMGADAEDLALTIHPHPTLSETVGLAAEAAEGTITDLYVAPGFDDPIVDEVVGQGARRHDLAPGVLERVADAVTPQPVAAVAGAIDVPIDALEKTDFVLVCVDVRDPGNLGTVLRTGEAAGTGGVICCEGSVDVYSPKTVRASAGSLFHVPVVAGGAPLEVLDRLGRWGLCRVGTHARTGTPYDEAALSRPTALVLGNEAHGVPDALSSMRIVVAWCNFPSSHTAFLSSGKFMRLRWTSMR